MTQKLMAAIRLWGVERVRRVANVPERKSVLKLFAALYQGSNWVQWKTLKARPARKSLGARMIKMLRETLANN